MTNVSQYRKSLARGRAAYSQAGLVKWVDKPWLLFQNVLQKKGLGGLYMKYIICLSSFIYKPWLVSAGGLNMRVAYPTNF